MGTQSSGREEEEEEEGKSGGSELHYHSYLPCPGITQEQLIIHSNVGTSRKFLFPWVFKAIPSFILGIVFSNPINEAESKILFSVDEHKLEEYNPQNTHWNILCIPCVQHCRTGVSVPCLPDFFLGGEVIQEQKVDCWT